MKRTAHTHRVRKSQKTMPRITVSTAEHKESAKQYFVPLWLDTKSEVITAGNYKVTVRL